METNILHVYAPGGPPLEISLEKIRKRGRLITAVVTKPSESNLVLIKRYSDEIFFLLDTPACWLGAELLSLTKICNAACILTFSEYLVNLVADIAITAGLRGPGKNSNLARNKILMRKRWEEYKLPQPKFHVVKNTEDLMEARKILNMPFVLKIPNCAGSVGILLVSNESEFEEKWEALRAVRANTTNLGKREYCEGLDTDAYLAEDVIESTTRSWYTQEGYGDFVSVEGIVRDGEYFPLAITARLPTIFPFTELGNIAPCPATNEKKKKIVELATRAVNALELENCATHTEIKLKNNEELELIETSARAGGVGIVKELEKVFDIDYVDILLSTLLSDERDIPQCEEFNTGLGAASVALIGTNASGNKWKTDRLFMVSQIKWGEILGNDVQVEVIKSQSRNEGDIFPEYDEQSGALCYAGQLFVETNVSNKLISHCLHIINNLETLLPLVVNDNC